MTCLEVSRNQRMCEGYDNLLGELTALRVENESLARERDCFRAVLEGAEYRDITGIAEKGIAFGLRLGQDAKNLTMAAMIERDTLRARVAELTEAQKALDEDFSERTEELIRSNARVAELETALRGVIAVADRDTSEFNFARAALGGKEE